MTSSQESRGDKYKELDRIEDATGLVGIISQRVESGVITFAIVREFELRDKPGEVGKTGFVPEHLIEEYVAMVDKIRDRILEIRVQGLAPKDRKIGPVTAAVVDAVKRR